MTVNSSCGLFRFKQFAFHAAMAIISSRDKAWNQRWWNLSASHRINLSGLYRDSTVSVLATGFWNVMLAVDAEFHCGSFLVFGQMAMA